MNAWKALSLGLLLVVAVAPALIAADEVRDVRVMGIWEGEYVYPDGTEMKNVSFKMVLIQEGDKVAGFIKEPNTFGKDQTDPFLHAIFKGKVDAKTGKLTFTKTYDGTSGIDHSVEYTGQLSKDGKGVEGTWVIKKDGQEDFSGKFTLKKASLDEKTLENLK